LLRNFIEIGLSFINRPGEVGLGCRSHNDWPQAQFLNLGERLEGWLKRNVYIDIEELPPPAEYDPIVAVERELLPLAFNVEVGAYINAIRSSLDILATALVRRHGIEINPEKVQFPVAQRDSSAQGT
jgi:hypothetical protein